MTGDLAVGDAEDVNLFVGDWGSCTQTVATS
jgi:hypothetical protein